MKKLSFVFLLCVLLLCLTLFIACGEDNILTPPTPDDGDGGNQPAAPAATEGLEYAMNDEEDGYVVIGMGDANVTDVIVPATHLGKPVVGIGSYAFSPETSNAAKRILSVTIQEGITYLEENAFHSCPDLEKVYIPGTVTSIGKDVVAECEEFEFNIYKRGSYLGTRERPYLAFIRGNVEDETTYEIHAETRVIADEAFYCFKDLTSVTLPDGLLTIGEKAFYACHDLADITLPTTLTTLGEQSFYMCNSLSSVNIPRGVTAIPIKAFYDCEDLTTVTLPDTLKTLESYAFLECSGLRSITIPGSVTKIGSGVFSGCVNLKTATIEEGVKYIAMSMFYNAGLTRVDIPSSVTAIHDYAFKSCSYLPSVTLHDEIAFIGPQAFMNCDELTSFRVPADTNELGDQFLASCKKLTTIAVADGNANYYAKDNCLIHRNTHTIIRGTASSVIPRDGSVRHIGPYAFSYLEDLTAVEIPNNIISIGEYAYYASSKIRVLTLPASLDSVGKSAFPALYDLTSFTFDGTTSQLKKVDFAEGWIVHYGSSAIRYIICTDGKVATEELPPEP